jgi:acetyl/propionyl-CoA carboxylase alpha subunit
VIYDVTIGEKIYRVELAQTGSGWLCKLDGREFPIDVAPLAGGVLSLLVNGRSYEVRQDDSAGRGNIDIGIVIGRERFSAVVRDPRSLRARRGRDRGAEGPKKIKAPMPGKVVRILAPPGSEVEFGQSVLVIEAMKMQNELKAPKKGKVSKLNVAEGAAVESGQTLAEVE